MADFDFITTRLATGAAITDPADVEALVAAGVTHVIDCTTNSFESTTLFAQHPALTVLYNPTEDDGSTKGIEWFEPTVEFGFMALSHPHQKLYCHCDAGQNRGPSTAFCVMLVMGWEYDTAIEMIHKARPVTIDHIRYAPDAANTLIEMGYLP